MADYKEIYCTLFRVQIKAKAILEEAEKKAEAMLMDSKDHALFVDFGDGKPDKKDDT